VKLAGYFDVPSIEHYLIADWEEREIIHYRREGGALAKPVILREGLLHAAAACEATSQIAAFLAPL
jgi:hypothetical protein